MTDNEKRAHDIAVATLPIMYKMRIAEAQNRGDDEIMVDLYTEYLSVYNQVLPGVNRDFPDVK